MAAATRHLLHPALPKSPTFRPTTAPSRLRLLGHPSWGETRPPPGHVHLRSSGSPGAEALQLALSAGYNVHLTTEEGESDEVLLRRFRREVSKAGVIPEGRRRRFYESTQEEKKRKAHEAGLRNRRRRYGPRGDPVSSISDSSPKDAEAEEDDDNWDMGLPPRRLFSLSSPPCFWQGLL